MGRCSLKAMCDQQDTQREDGSYGSSPLHGGSALWTAGVGVMDRGDEQRPRHRRTRGLTTIL